MGPESYDFVYFIGKEADTDGGRAEPEQQELDKPKDQEEKLVKINLANQ